MVVDTSEAKFTLSMSILCVVIRSKYEPSL